MDTVIDAIEATHLEGLERVLAAAIDRARAMVVERITAAAEPVAMNQPAVVASAWKEEA